MRASALARCLGPGLVWMASWMRTTQSSSSRARCESRGLGRRLVLTRLLRPRPQPRRFVPRLRWLRQPSRSRPSRFRTTTAPPATRPRSRRRCVLYLPLRSPARRSAPRPVHQLPPLRHPPPRPIVSHPHLSIARPPSQSSPRPPSLRTTRAVVSARRRASAWFARPSPTIRTF